MGYFDTSDLTDVIDEIKDLVETHAEYDSIELVENAEKFETEMLELVKKADRLADNFSTEYDELEEKYERLESKYDELEEKFDGLETDNENLNLYDLQRKRICLDFFNNLSLQQLENLEQTVKTYHNSTYLTSSLLDME